MRKSEKIAKVIFCIAACVSIAAVILICIFLFVSGVPAIKEVGLVKFLTGEIWRPRNNLYGIFPMIIGSVVITIGTIIVGVPIGIATAVFLAKYCPAKIYSPIKRAVELLAGIPSVVYGFFGMMVIVPFIREVGRMFGYYESGSSILTASLLLGIMILPTIIGITESSLRAVPSAYFEGGLALGATKEYTILKILIPAARSGVVTAIVLGIGRAIGETMAVIMVAGNQAQVPSNIFKGVRTLTANIVMEMGYAIDLHRDVLIATAVVLFIFILVLNLFVALLKRKEY